MQNIRKAFGLAMMIMAHQYNTPQITLKVTSWLPRISHSSEYREAAISAPNRQNTVRLIFEKNELGAFLERLRPPLSIAGSFMTLAGL